MAFSGEEHLRWRNLHKIHAGFWISNVHKSGKIHEIIHHESRGQGLDRSTAEPRNVSCPPTRPPQQFRRRPRQPKRSTCRPKRRKTWPQWILTSSCNLVYGCFDHPRSGGVWGSFLGVFFPERLGEGRFLGAVSLSSMTWLAWPQLA